MAIRKTTQQRANRGANTANMRVCAVCKRRRRLSSFPSDSTQKYGRSYKCKDCQREIGRERYHRYYHRNIEETRERSRLDRKERPELPAAHQKVFKAKRAGKLMRQPCEVCGAKRTIAHHSDYFKPLKVTWLCHSCHKKVHLQIEREEHL